MPKLIKGEFIKKDAIIHYLNWRIEFEKNDYFQTTIGQARWHLVRDIKEFVERMNVYSLAVPTCQECASFRPGSENGYCREHDRFVEFTDFCSRGTPVDKSSTITAPVKPLTLDELHKIEEDDEGEDPAPPSTTEETKIGRLIDADALAKEVENAYKFAIGEVRQAYSFILDLIADAPTIPTPKPEDEKK